MKKRLLFIGNSFSEDTAFYIPYIAKNYGIDIDVDVLYIGGCEIEQHINNIKTSEKKYLLESNSTDFNLIEYKEDVDISTFLKSKSWDYISLQQASHRTCVKDGMAKINELYDLVKGLINNNPIFVFNMTWAYPSYSDIPFFKEIFKSNPSKMLDVIKENVKKDILNNSRFAFIAPNGLMVNNVMPILGESRMYRDVLHMSLDDGRFLASLVFLKTIFGIDLDALNAFPSSTLFINYKEIKKAINQAFIDLNNLQNYARHLSDI